MQRRPSLAIALTAALFVAVGSPASSQGAVASSTSSNWAGYGITSARTRFTRVSGTWRQPAAKCTSGHSSYAAFWVGLGGDLSSSRSLEQIGTEVDCTARGQAVYSTWYELFPADPYPIHIRVAPGDLVSAHVSVRGREVTLYLRDATAGGSFAKRTQMSSPDGSSAEWIAEAESDCDSCRVLPLTNFGTVGFWGSATTANGHTGKISDPAWKATSISLLSVRSELQSSRFGYRRLGSEAAPASATPSPLSTDGTFSIGWHR